MLAWASVLAALMLLLLAWVAISPDWLDKRSGALQAAAAVFTALTIPITIVFGFLSIRSSQAATDAQIVIDMRERYQERCVPAELKLYELLKLGGGPGAPNIDQKSYVELYRRFHDRRLVEGRLPNGMDVPTSVQQLEDVTEAFRELVFWFNTLATHDALWAMSQDAVRRILDHRKVESYRKFVEPVLRTMSDGSGQEETSAFLNRYYPLPHGRS